MAARDGRDSDCVPTRSAPKTDWRKSPYIRESRRIQAEFTVVEQIVGTEARGKDTAEPFADSVGVGSYRIDLHPSTGGNNYIDVSSLPFQIPLGALLPKRVENLLPACKNIGTTHITNGCYRLHPVEWNIGESAGHAGRAGDRDLAAPARTYAAGPSCLPGSRPSCRRRASRSPGRS